MKTFKQEQFLPITLDEAWDFFSSPHNLNKITPNNMSFEITSEVPQKMYEGMMITYKIRPFLNIPFDWCTEITKISEGCYFIDEQRIGPYKLWHHEHHFKAVDGGVLMTDLLFYDIGMSIIGTLVGALFVDKKVNHIFDFRKQMLSNFFSKK